MVGDITEEDLRYVDCYIDKDMSIFIPSTGFCQYAIRTSHTHPAYSFVVFFSKEQSFLKQNIYLPEEHYLAAALSPDIPHEEKETDEFTRYIAIMISRESFEKIYIENYGNKPIKKLLWKQFPVSQDIMMYIRRFMAEYQNKILGYQKIVEALSTLISHCLIRDLYKVNIKSHYTDNKFGIDRIIEY